MFRGILVFWIALYLASFATITPLAVLLINLFIAGIIWVLVENKMLRLGFIVLFILTSPLLLIHEYYVATLFSAGLAYFSHMLADAVTHEWWTIEDIFGVRISFPSIIRIPSNGNVETHVLYPIMFLLIVASLFSNHSQLLPEYKKELQLSLEQWVNMPQAITEGKVLIQKIHK